MLQQTQVATVIPYYTRWLDAFPDLASLARAPRQEVLKRWEGLGYYRRARHLHRAARQLVERHRGSFPATARELRELPGVGAYTSAAIASIVFGERVLAIDGNVRRVAARLFALPGRPTDREVASRLSPLQPEDRAGDFNEALMELGALICRPRAPTCDGCPLRDHCTALRLGEVDRYPEPTRRTPPPLRERFAPVALDGDRITLVRRDEDAMLGGLWGFPETHEPPLGATLLDPVIHHYSHFTLSLTPALTGAPPAAGAQSVPLADLARLPLAGVDRKVLARLREQGLIA